MRCEELRGARSPSDDDDEEFESEDDEEDLRDFLECLEDLRFGEASRLSCLSIFFCSAIRACLSAFDILVIVVE